MRKDIITFSYPSGTKVLSKTHAVVFVISSFIGAQHGH